MAGAIVEFKLMNKFDLFINEKWVIVTIIDLNLDSGRCLVHFDGSNNDDQWIVINSATYAKLNTKTLFHDYLSNDKMEPCGNTTSMKCINCNKFYCYDCLMVHGKCKQCIISSEYKFFFEILYQSLDNLSYLKHGINIAILAKTLLDYTSIMQIFQCHNKYCNEYITFDCPFDFERNKYKNIYTYEVNKRNNITNTTLLFQKHRRIFCSKCSKYKLNIIGKRKNQYRRYTHTCHYDDNPSNCNEICDKYCYAYDSYETHYNYGKMNKCIIENCNNFDFKCICNNHRFPICVCCKHPITNESYNCKESNCNKQCHIECSYVHIYYHAQIYQCLTNVQKKRRLSNSKNNRNCQVLKNSNYKRRKWKQKLPTINNTEYKYITIKKRKKYKRKKRRPTQFDYNEIYEHDMHYSTDEYDNTESVNYDEYADIKTISVNRYHKKKYLESKHIIKHNKARKWKNIKKHRKRKCFKRKVKCKDIPKETYINDYHEEINILKQWNMAMKYSNINNLPSNIIDKIYKNMYSNELKFVHSIFEHDFYILCNIYFNLKISAAKLNFDLEREYGEVLDDMRCFDEFWHFWRFRNNFPSNIIDKIYKNMYSNELKFVHSIFEHDFYILCNIYFNLKISAAKLNFDLEREYGEVLDDMRCFDEFWHFWRFRNNFPSNIIDKIYKSMYLNEFKFGYDIFRHDFDILFSIYEQIICNLERGYDSVFSNLSSTVNSQYIDSYYSDGSRFYDDNVNSQDIGSYSDNNECYVDYCSDYSSDICLDSFDELSMSDGEVVHTNGSDLIGYKTFNSAKYYQHHKRKYSKSNKDKQIGKHDKNYWKRKKERRSNVKSKNKSQNKYNILCSCFDEITSS
eukprot:178040_1